jgi:hypothetical protein
MNLDLFLTTDELAVLLKRQDRKDPRASAIKWAKARHIQPADGGRMKLWPKDDVLAALYRTRRPRIRRVS